MKDVVVDPPRVVVTALVVGTVYGAALAGGPELEQRG